MIDLQLSSLFINQLLTMGLPAVDQSLMKLLEAMETFPKSAVLFNAVSIAKTLGLLLALCMGSYECWMMMLGRRGMDVMKLLRIAALSICITTSSYICSALKAPGKGLETTAMMMAQAKNREVAALELKVAEKQAGYLKRLREVQDSIETAKQVQAIGEDAHWWDKLIYNMENLGSTINNYAQRAAVAAETKVSEWINDVIRFIGELIFQMSYYGMLVAQRIFLTIMATFAPIMFALSIVPPWSNAWSQWISKYLSLSLWGFVVYMCLYYIDFILMYNLRADIKAYESLLQGTVNSWDQIGALGLQGIGSNCMYAMGMLVGAFSSSAGTAAGSTATTIVQGGVSHGISTTTATIGTAAAVATGGASLAASVAGAAQQSRSDGGSKLAQASRTVMSQTSLGASYIRGADSVRSMNNVGKSDSNYKPGGADGK